MLTTQLYSIVMNPSRCGICKTYNCSPCQMSANYETMVVYVADFLLRLGRYDESVSCYWVTSSCYLATCSVVYFQFHEQMWYAPFRLVTTFY